MISAENEINVVKFEKRDNSSSEVMPLMSNNIVRLRNTSDGQRNVATELQASKDQSSGGCEDGVCVIAWKPRRPTAVA